MHTRSIKITVSVWLASLFLSVSSALAASGDWPQWRGSNRDGRSTETGLMQSWPTEGPPLVWKATDLGAGYSGVSLVGRRIFTMGDIGEESHVLALDRAQGKKLWGTRVGRAGGGGGYPGPRCTPTVDGSRVFALNQHGDLICVEAADGREVWRKNLARDLGGRMMSGWGYSESPLVDGDHVVITPGGSRGTIAALDKKTGAPVWQSKEFTDAAAYSSLVIAEFGGVRQYVQITDASVAGVRASDGHLLWRARRRGQTAVIPTPIIHDNHVYVTSGYGIGCNLFKISATGGAFKAEEVYANKTMINHHGGVILLGEHLYGYSDGKGWVCQDFKSGEEVWSDKSLGKGAIAYADGRFYLRSEGGPGTLVLIEASPKGYVEKGRFNQPDRSKRNSWPHPVIADGKLYLRDQNVLLCFDVKQK
jgi:outer membrane protein assembly factor BamB